MTYFFVHKKQVLFFFNFFNVYKIPVCCLNRYSRQNTMEYQKKFFFQMCCFYFLGRVRFYIRLEDIFKHCIALAHCPRIQYQRRQNENAYQSASCDFWNFLINHFCIKRMCKYLFFLFMVSKCIFLRTILFNEI